ncbi:L,D-transpeptidase family protein [Thalassotalea euphylliae]|uniref:L,D-transpeptidase family protein n=1 Tax=Thalassotalea euphylliae TaxID=1655234 RepID=UPI00362D90C9
MLAFCLSLPFFLASISAAAATYILPPENQRLIGQPVVHPVGEGDFFQVLAEQYNVGFLALLAANPNIDPYLPAVGSRVIIPAQMLLPFGERKGIIVNLPELRLYYFDPEHPLVHVFPVGIGRLGLETPRTTTYIGEKRKDPIWRPGPEMKQRYLEEKGIELADEVLPGPNNPFGKYALRLATSEYLIHGTNQRFGVGTRASSGCIRMYDDDIRWLYDNVPLNTSVKIIDQPLKMSFEASGRKLFEVHQPLTSDEQEKQIAENQVLLEKFVGEELIDKHLKDYMQPSGLVLEVISD